MPIVTRANDLVGRTIIAAKLHRTSNGRGGWLFQPTIELDDRTVLTFPVQESDVGEYGVAINRHGMARKMASEPKGRTARMLRRMINDKKELKP